MLRVNKEYKVLENNTYNRGQTKTTQLFMPVLGFIAEEMPNNFINAYINDKNNMLNFDCLNLLFYIDSVEEYNNNKLWISFHNYYTNKDNFIDFYSNGIINNKETIVFRYKIPEEYLETLRLFFDGKYSKYSIEVKNKFPKMVKKEGQIVETLINQILYKKEELKKSWEELLSFNGSAFQHLIEFPEEYELWQKPLISEELLNNN